MCLYLVFMALNPPLAFLTKLLPGHLLSSTSSSFNGDNNHGSNGDNNHGSNVVSIGNNNDNVKITIKSINEIELVSDYRNVRSTWSHCDDSVVINGVTCATTTNALHV